MLTRRFLDWAFAFVEHCPWPTLAGAEESPIGTTAVPADRLRDRIPIVPIYTPEERLRRDRSPWTRVQGLLAPIQFLAFFISLWLILHYLTTGRGLTIATSSVVVKTLLLYAIMITGSIWEHEVFGKYLFARAFFWEDVVSMLVLALHTAYLAAMYFDLLDADRLLLLALAAYASYAINATQFLLKLRAARGEQHARLDRDSYRLGGVG
jgi:3-vinyl bacteriochlorophyllide hydratase